MAADSTSGKTQEEILSFLGSHEFRVELSCLQKSLSRDRSLSVANAVCAREDIAQTIHQG